MIRDDFDSALRGEKGFRGVEPSVAAGLFRLGLITEEQAWEAAQEYQEDWSDAWDDENWWWKTAELAWYTSTSFWKRLFSAGYPTYSWRKKWLEEHRGW